MAAVILLVAIIAAIALTLRKRKDSKYQDPSDQVRVQAHRPRVIEMRRGQAPPPAAERLPRRHKHDLDPRPLPVAGRDAVRHRR